MVIKRNQKKRIIRADINLFISVFIYDCDLFEFITRVVRDVSFTSLSFLNGVGFIVYFDFHY